MERIEPARGEPKASPGVPEHLPTSQPHASKV